VELCTFPRVNPRRRARMDQGVCSLIGGHARTPPAAPNRATPSPLLIFAAPLLLFAAALWPCPPSAYCGPFVFGQACDGACVPVPRCACLFTACSMPHPPLLMSGLGACGPFLSRPCLFAVQGGGLETVHCLQADSCCRRCHLCSAAQHHRAPQHRCCALRPARAPLPGSFLICPFPALCSRRPAGSSLPGAPAGLQPMTDPAPGGIGPTGPGGQVCAPEGVVLKCANELVWVHSGWHRRSGENVQSCCLFLKIRAERVWGANLQQYSTTLMFEIPAPPRPPRIFMCTPSYDGAVMCTGDRTARSLLIRAPSYDGVPAI
jgi:hypothetical protein